MADQVMPDRRRMGVLAAVGVVVLAVVLLLPGLPRASAQHEVAPTRIDGATRFHTAANIATATFDQADVAHLVTGANYPDALAGSFAAGSADAPLLLSGAEVLPAATRAALEQLEVERVVLIGGAGAIDPAVEQELADAGYATDRIAGTDRFATAAAVATHFGGQRVGTVDGQRAAFVATGEHFADALAAGPIAAREGLPLLLTPHDRTDPNVTDALAHLDIDKIYLLGGTQAVSENVEESYREQGYDVERLGGPTLMDTAWLLADTAVHDFGFTHERVLLARGDDYPDALAASVHGATMGAPIVLTATADDLSGPTRDWLTRTCPGIRALRALGGTGAISDTVLHQAVAAAEACHDSAEEDTAVAVTADGRVVVLDADTGEERRELMAGVPTDDPAKNDVAVTPDRTEAYVAVPAEETGERPSIVRVPLDGGEPQTVIEDGYFPAVSPDGGTLAYVDFAGDDVGDPDARLVVRDLGTGDEARLAGRDQGFHFISDVEWTADGEQMVFTAGEIHTGVYAIDAEATSMEQARRLGPGDREDGEASWSSTAAFGDRMAVTEICCDVPEPQQWHVIEVDPADGEDHGRLVPAERFEATHLDSNADATGLLSVLGGGPDGGELVRWGGHGSPTSVADDIIVAAW